jgi:hypothetical protein
MQKLHLKETGLQNEVMLQRGERADAQSQVRKLQCDIAELADAIQDPKALKEKVSGASSMRLWLLWGEYSVHALMCVSVWSYSAPRPAQLL